MARSRVDPRLSRCRRFVFVQRLEDADAKTRALVEQCDTLVRVTIAWKELKVEPGDPALRRTQALHCISVEKRKECRELEACLRPALDTHLIPDLAAIVVDYLLAPCTKSV